VTPLMPQMRLFLNFLDSMLEEQGRNGFNARLTDDNK
jgi:hypothetical protein